MIAALSGLVVLGIIAALNVRQSAVRADRGPDIGPRAEFARRLLKHVVRKRIADLRDGDAAVIRATVRALRTVPQLRAPLSGLPAVALNVRMIDDLGRVFVDEYACVDFELVDETGAIRIDGAGVDVAIVQVAPRAWAQHLIPPRWWQRVGAWAPYLWTGTEGVIADGTEVLVFGMAHTDLSAAANYRGAEQQLVIRASPSFPVALSNDEDLFVPGKKLLSVAELIQRKNA